VLVRVIVLAPATSRSAPVAMIDACPFIRRGTDATVPIVPGLVRVIVPPAKSSGSNRLVRDFSTSDS